MSRNRIILSPVAISLKMKSDVYYCYVVCNLLGSYSVPYGGQGQNKKGKTKGLHMEILKTGVLHKEICVQSLRETVKCRDKGKNKRMLQKDAFLRMCVL